MHFDNTKSEIINFIKNINAVEYGKFDTFEESYQSKYYDTKYYVVTVNTRDKHDHITFTITSDYSLNKLNEVKDLCINHIKNYKLKKRN